MPLWIFPTGLALGIITTMGAGIWLLLHLTSLARTFAGNADIGPSPKPPRASRTSVRLALAAFGGGLLLTLAIEILTMTGAANRLIG